MYKLKWNSIPRSLRVDYHALLQGFYQKDLRKFNLLDFLGGMGGGGGGVLLPSYVTPVALLQESRLGWGNADII